MFRLLNAVYKGPAFLYKMSTIWDHLKVVTLVSVLDVFFFQLVNWVFDILYVNFSCFMELQRKSSVSCTLTRNQKIITLLIKEESLRLVYSTFSLVTINLFHGGVIVRITAIAVEPWEKKSNLDNSNSLLTRTESHFSIIFTQLTRTWITQIPRELKLNYLSHDSTSGSCYPTRMPSH